MVKLIPPQQSISIKHIDLLPSNYDFNIEKTIKLIQKYKLKKIALQFPDGLLKYSFYLKKIFSEYADVFVLGDVVYGACCIDDISAKNLNCDLLVHYGHSCLININDMLIRCLYVFVDIRFDFTNLKETFFKHFIGKKVALFCTVQFLSAVQFLKREIEIFNLQNSNKIELELPRINPLSSGEVLGCTSPLINSNVVFFIGDGRFHLESVMLNNPNKLYFQYCPSTKKTTQEFYNYNLTLERRNLALKKFKSCVNIGLIISNLGRQTNFGLLRNVKKKLELLNKKVFLIKVQEIKEESLKFEFIEGFVQLNCTRLSIDWGMCFDKPIINPYELFNDKIVKYEMDFYAKDSQAEWKNN